MDFSDPYTAVCGGSTFSTQANDLNGGFDQVTPPPNSTAVDLSAPSSAPVLPGNNGFNVGGSAQNLMTDPNAMGFNAGGMSFGPDWLANPRPAALYPNGDNDADERIGPAAYTNNDSL